MVICERYQEAERAFEKMADRTSLERLMHDKDIEQQRSIISYLRYFESQFETKHAVPGLIVLLNLLERVPGHLQVELSSIRSDVNDVSVLLLGTLGEKRQLREVVRVVLKELKSLSAKTDLVMLLGHDREKGRKLLTETEMFQYEEHIREEMRDTSVDRLIEEFDLHQVLTFVRRRRFALKRASVKLEEDPRLTFAVLWAVGKQGSAQWSSIDWKLLEEVYGGKKELTMRIKKMDAEFEKAASWIEARKIGPEVVENIRESAASYMKGENGSRSSRR